jgi:hypothetical protein
MRMGVMNGAVLAVMGLALSAAGPVWAQGRGHGLEKKEQSLERTTSRAAERVAEEAVDAVTDELAGEDGGTAGMPPGLAKKNKMPPGLEQQDKTPEGWAHGQKTGWDKTPGTQRESFVRRLIRGIFRRGQQPSSTAPGTTEAD